MFSIPRGSYSIFCLFLSFSIFFPFWGDLKAQSEEERLEIIDEEEEESRSTGITYWDEHFDASFGFSYAYGLDGRSHRAYSYARLGWKDDFDWVQFHVEALVFRRDYQYSLELNPDDSSALGKELQALDTEIQFPTMRPPMSPPNRSLDDICSSPSPLPLMPSEGLRDLDKKRKGLCESRERRKERLEYTLQIVDDALLWREAHAKFSIGDEVQFLAGWHTIVWGQLDFLSPVDFILPFRLGSTGLGISKADNRNPQLSAILYYFPTSWMEIQAYFFPKLGIDNAFLDNIENESTAEAGSPYVDTEAIALPRGSEAYRYAGRFLFYLDNFTLGFVYYHGFFQFGVDENLKLGQDTKNGETIYRLEGKNKLSPLRAFGIESAYPLGKWVWKLDTIYLPLKESLSFDVERYNNQILGYLSEDEFFDKRRAYVDWILKENNGSLEISDNVIVSALGVDADLDSWLLNLGVLFFYTGRSSSEKRGYRLYLEAEDTEDGPFDDSEVFAAPIVNVAYYLNQDKKNAVGAAAGFLNTGFGLILYTAQEYFESLRLAISFEYLVLFSNGLVDVEGYQLDNPAYPAIRFIFDYQL